MKFLKKSLGQNFLVDKNIIKKIINCSVFQNRDIVEIGPGKGALTKEILKKKPKSLFLIEKDNILANDLRKEYFKNKLVKIVNNDVLKLNLEKVLKKNSLIIGNLPYNISSQILVKFLKFKNWPPKFEDLIFMFQKELGDKIVGKYLSPYYGRLSIITNYRLKIINSFLVSRNCFFPKPKVTSQVIHFQPIKKIKIKIKNIENLEKVTNIIFSNKRKMINKSIKKILYTKKIKKMPELNLKIRPADLKPNLFYKITKLYEN